MTLYECYKARQGALMTALYSAKTLAEGSECMSRALDATVSDYCGVCDDPELGEYAAAMAGAAKCAIPLGECAEGSIVQKIKTDEKPAKGRFKAGVPLVLAVLGLLVMALDAVIFISRSADALSGGWRSEAVIFGCGFICFAAGCFMLGRSLGAKGRERAGQRGGELAVELRYSPEDICRRMAAVVMLMDKNIAAKSAQLAAAKAQKAAGALDDQTVELIAQLLEAERSGSGEIALESLGEFEHRLCRSGFEIRDYSAADESMFTLLPGDETATLRPALLANGTVRCKGLATVAGEGEA